MSKTLTEIKNDLINLSEAAHCDSVTLKDCYVDNGITYSIMYKKTENKTYTVTSDNVISEIIIS